MPWQDYAFTAGSLLLGAGLIPSLLGKSKPAFWTSLISGSVLLAFGFTFYTLSLWASSSAATIQGVLWFILAYQKLKARRVNGGISPRQRLKHSIRTAKNE